MDIKNLIESKTKTTVYAVEIMNTRKTNVGTAYDCRYITACGDFFTTITIG